MSKGSRGFTLLEVIVVITIIGILTGVTVLSFGAISQRRLDSEAGRLQLAFNQAEDTALMQQQVIGWFYNPKRGEYSFRYWQENDAGEPAWEKIPQAIFAPYKMNPDLAVVVDLKIVTEANNADRTGLIRDDIDEPPLIVFLNNGEYQPFEIKLINKAGAAITLFGDGFNTIRTLTPAT